MGNFHCSFDREKSPALKATAQVNAAEGLPSRLRSELDAGALGVGMGIQFTPGAARPGVTTISPYLFFWQAAQKVEDTKAKPTGRRRGHHDGESNEVGDTHSNQRIELNSSQRGTLARLL